MTQHAVIDLIRSALWTGFWVAAPLLAVGFVIGLIMNVVQVATSLQDSSFAFVPKLTAFLVAGVICMPWMFSKLTTYTVLLPLFQPTALRGLGQLKGLHGLRQEFDVASVVAQVVAICAGAQQFTDQIREHGIVFPRSHREMPVGKLGGFGAARVE